MKKDQVVFEQMKDAFTKFTTIQASTDYYLSKHEDPQCMMNLRALHVGNRTILTPQK